MPRTMRRRRRGRLPTFLSASQRTCDIYECSYAPIKMTLDREGTSSFTCESCTPHQSSISSSVKNVVVVPSESVDQNKNNERLIKKTDTESHGSKKKTKSAKVVSYANRLFDENGIGPSGHILARTTKASLFFRIWKEYYWAHLYPAILVLFRSKEDFQIWKKIENDYPTGNKLIMWSINFDTMGFLEKKLKKKLKKERAFLLQKKMENKRTCHKEDISYIEKDSDTKRTCPPSAVFKYAMMDVHSKLYDKKGPVIHGFKLERWSQVGTGVTAAFASADPHEVKALREVISLCLTMTSRPHRRKKKKNMKKKSERTSICTASTSPSASQ